MSKKTLVNGSLKDAWFALLGTVPLVLEEGARLFRNASRRGNRLQSDLMKQAGEISKKIPLMHGKKAVEKKSAAISR